MFKLFRKRLKNQKGFTLVELMVVVVIIGILVGIAVPSYNKVTKTAEKTACEANMRVIYGAIQIYRADEGKLPQNMEDLEEYFEGNVPTCPSAEGEGDGEYTIDDGGIVSCNIDDHGTYPKEDESET